MASPIRIGLQGDVIVLHPLLRSCSLLAMRNPNATGVGLSLPAETIPKEGIARLRRSCRRRAQAQRHLERRVHPDVDDRSRVAAELAQEDGIRSRRSDRRGIPGTVEVQLHTARASSGVPSENLRPLRR